MFFIHSLFLTICLIKFVYSEKLGDKYEYKVNNTISEFLVPPVGDLAIGFTVSVTLKTDVVGRQETKYKPIDQFICSLTVPYEFATFIDINYPWRMPVMKAYEISDGLAPNRSAVPPILVSAKDRLEAEELHNIIYQVKYIDYKLSFFFFLNGRLRAETSIVTLLNHFMDKETEYILESSATTDTSRTVSYWPRLLSYREIRNIAIKTRTSHQPTFQPTLAWLTGGLLATTADEPNQAASSCIIGSDGLATCPDVSKARSQEKSQEDVTILLWPSWYSDAGETLPIWVMREQLTDSLISIAETITSSSTAVLEVLVILREHDYLGLIEVITELSLEHSKYQLSAISMDTHETYADAANRAVNQAKGSYIFLLSSHILPAENWISPLLAALKAGAAIAGGKIINLKGQILHAGFEFLSLPYAGGLEVFLTPHDRYRGYWAGDSRTLGVNPAYAVSRRMMALAKRTWLDLGGLSAVMSPLVEDVDICARALHRGLQVVVVGEVQGVSVGPLLLSSDREEAYTSEIYNPRSMSTPFLAALRAFSELWSDFFNTRRSDKYLSKSRFTWVIHCGGSQGYEAATILQEMYKFVDVRTIIRRYRECEHADTISGMPAFFRDILEYTTLRIFTKPYQGPVVFRNNSGMYNPIDRENDNSIVLYARDYREIGRWVPFDAAMIIGRYMYEANGLPRAWMLHMNKLDEVWVPSKWQKDMFAAAGVKEEKLHVLPETVDSNYFNPDLVADLAMPGSVLDGFDREDPKRPYTLCSVYKMEDRKGWQDLIKAYTLEFAATDNVVLLLRTYLHLMGGLTDDVYDRTEIYSRMSDYLDTVPGIPHRAYRPTIDLVSDHLPSWQMPMFYKACDAFVLPTHGEGWGLPTHEAMAMGLPVITTNWGGSTEFVTKDSGLLVDTDGLVPTTDTDPWLKGFKWANISIADLRRKMRYVYANKAAAKAIGQKGRAYVLKHFSPEAVARAYALRLDHLNKHIIPTLPEDHVINVTATFERAWDMPFGRFRACAVTKPSTHAIGQIKSEVRRNGRVLKTLGAGALCDYVIITTWRPRECGIATFSDALREALFSVCPSGARIDIIAMKHDNDDPKRYDKADVKFFINEYEPNDYIHAANFINENDYGTVLVEYEFGMMVGSYLMCMLRQIKARIITTVHTVTKSYTEENQGYMQQVLLLSYKAIVMTNTMRHSLVAHHAIPVKDIVVIPHGVPDLPFDRREGTPQQSFYPGKKVIFSNGLLHQKKGIEYMIRAMPRILDKFPDAIYVVQGKPHPTGWGAKDYYKEVQKMAKRFAKDHVIFNETFVPTEELYTMLQSVSVYVNAYIDFDQAVSGTLAMAMGTGAAVVSTPYPYAMEMLRNNTGILVPFMDSAALTDAVISLLENPDATAEMRRKAYDVAQNQIWEKVGQAYLQLSILD